MDIIKKILLNLGKKVLIVVLCIIGILFMLWGSNSPMGAFYLFGVSITVFAVYQGIKAEKIEKLEKKIDELEFENRRIIKLNHERAKTRSEELKKRIT